MPDSALRPCLFPGCPETVIDGYCEQHTKTKRRCTRKTPPHQKLYNHKWRKMREQFLMRNPLCLRCKDEGRLVPAAVVDHIKPHKGDALLFYNTNNWQSLCKVCHDRKTYHEDGGMGRS